LISLDVVNSKLNDVITSIISECGISIFIQTTLEGNVNASFTNMPIEDALTYLLLNTKYSYSEIGGLYFVGGKDQEDLYDSQLLRLKHLIASSVAEQIPVSLSKQVIVKVAKEHNGLIVTGPRTSIARLKEFIDEIDIPTAQVLFDILVVDYNLTEAFKLGIILEEIPVYLAKLIIRI
jgi:type II secretory pathway component GspD/PulD (secretin)